MYVKNLWECEHFVSEGQPDVEYFLAIPEEMTLGLDLHGVKVGKPMKEHSHKHIEQIYYIRSGKGILKVGDEERVVGEDDVIYIPAGVPHAIRPAAGEKNLTYLFFSHYHEVHKKPE